MDQISAKDDSDIQKNWCVYSVCYVAFSFICLMVAVFLCGSEVVYDLLYVYSWQRQDRFAHKLSLISAFYILTKNLLCIGLGYIAEAYHLSVL